MYYSLIDIFIFYLYIDTFILSRLLKTFYIQAKILKLVLSKTVKLQLMEYENI